MTLPTLSFALLLVAAAFQAVFAFKRKGGLDPVSPFLLGASIALLALTLGIRTVGMSFPAITNLYESLVFFSLAVSAVALAFRLFRRPRISPLVLFGSTVAAAALLALASSPLAPKEVLPPVPALRSYWLVLHVSLAFVGESFFVVAFVSSLLFLATGDGERRTFLDRITYTAIGIGYPIFTAGALVFGAVWAQVAWGSWWSWDPKETWSLVTWLIFSLYLHLRLIRKRTDSLPSIVAAAGFLFALFTFLGVNFLLPGLHAYGG
jgi:ABC-type transport system involved in cytochrome c biogenesis permease subunit